MNIAITTMGTDNPNTISIGLLTCGISADKIVLDLKNKIKCHFILQVRINDYTIKCNLGILKK